jgi:hypothetical protein
MTLEEVISYCRKNERVCPVPQRWHKFYELLPDKRRHAAGWVPPLPLILAAWWEASDEAKQERLEQHIRWAAEHGALDQVAKFVQSLAEASGTMLGSENLGRSQRHDVGTCNSTGPLQQPRLHRSFCEFLLLPAPDSLVFCPQALQYLVAHSSAVSGLSDMMCCRMSPSW